MKTAWYVLVGEEDTKETDCTMTGAYWLEAKSGEYRCFYLTRPSDSHNCGNSDPKTVRPLSLTSINSTDLYTVCFRCLAAALRCKQQNGHWCIH